MGNHKHILIDKLGDEYAAKISGDMLTEDTARIKAAYVAGAEATLERVRNVLKVDAGLGGIRREDINGLLMLIEVVETKLTSDRI